MYRHAESSDPEGDFYACIVEDYQVDQRVIAKQLRNIRVCVQMPIAAAKLCVIYKQQYFAKV